MVQWKSACKLFSERIHLHNLFRVCLLSKWLEASFISLSWPFSSLESNLEFNILCLCDSISLMLIGNGNIRALQVTKVS